MTIRSRLSLSFNSRPSICDPLLWVNLEKEALEPAVPFGLPMRSNHFIYEKAYTPLNHGSYGAFPDAVRDYRIQLQDQIKARPDPVIRDILPPLLEEARAAIAPLLGVPTDEVVFVPNATTAVNTVLRNLVFEEGDVIVCFSTAYGACEKTIDYVCETTPLQSTSVMLEYPMEDVEVVQKFIERVGDVHQSGRKGEDRHVRHRTHLSRCENAMGGIGEGL